MQTKHAFSLVEVIVAIGLVAGALLAILGLLAATTSSTAESEDAQGIASLGGSIQCELERLKNSIGLASLAGLVPAGGSATPLRLVGTRDCLRVLCVDPVDPAANRPLSDPALPGIAERDRFFLVELTRVPDLEAAVESGFIAVSARCTWPCELPTGPATPGASEFDVDPARAVPAADRHVAILQIAVTP
jgi:hypothetical protein